MTHCTQADRDAHPCFAAAKSGDRHAALALVATLLSPAALDRLDLLLPDDCYIVGVAALETTGFNAIPDAMAREIGALLDRPVWEGVIQANRVAHTKASGWHRLVTPALFEGAIDQGRSHLLVDDHVGLGGTLANFRGHIENHGGKVVAMTTLSASRDAEVIAVRPETLIVLRERHGDDLENLWQDTFGHGLDGLTEVEAGYLARQLSVDLIRARMVEAAEQARRRGVSAVPLAAGD